LFQDLLAVGDKEQRRIGSLLSHSRVIERCDHGLASTGGRNDEVSHVAMTTLDLECIEYCLLMWIGPK
jgi:hypothetical protein